MVPTATQLKSRTGSGAQTASGLVGTVVIESGSGSLTLTDVGGAAEARTGSGSIHAHGIGGAFTGNTGSGGIDLVQTGQGDVVVSTGSGGVDLKGVDGAVRVRTGSGSITIDGKPTGPWELDTGSGAVRARMSPDAAFTIDAKAGVRRASARVRRSRLSGSVERGQLQGRSAAVARPWRIRTGSGGISVD